MYDRYIQDQIKQPYLNHFDISIFVDYLYNNYNIKLNILDEIKKEQLTVIFINFQNSNFKNIYKYNNNELLAIIVLISLFKICSNNSIEDISNYININILEKVLQINITKCIQVAFHYYIERSITMYYNDIYTNVRSQVNKNMYVYDKLDRLQKDIDVDIDNIIRNVIPFFRRQIHTYENTYDYLYSIILSVYKDIVSICDNKLDNTNVGIDINYIYLINNERKK